ncbi:MAG: acid stress chaperone HdeB [Alphaproteobacteria bacterium]|jgi:acid stress chaperone HdeB|nr:acid stress chaperone HdeB [Alphaproteobacteria bacterium]
MKISSAALVAALVFASAPAGAQVLDLSSVKCKEFAESNKETSALIYMWLEGYHTEEEDPAVIDFDKIKVTSEKLRQYCAQNPRVGLLSAAEKVMSK